jgi:hypothetical protein
VSGFGLYVAASLEIFIGLLIGKLFTLFVVNLETFFVPKLKGRVGFNVYNVKCILLRDCSNWTFERCCFIFLGVCGIVLKLIVYYIGEFGRSLFGY